MQKAGLACNSIKLISEAFLQRAGSDRRRLRAEPRRRHPRRRHPRPIKHPGKSDKAKRSRGWWQMTDKPDKASWDSGGFPQDPAPLPPFILPRAFKTRLKSRSTSDGTARTRAAELGRSGRYWLYSLKNPQGFADAFRSPCPPQLHHFCPAGSGDAAVSPVPLPPWSVPQRTGRFGREE